MRQVVEDKCRFGTAVEAKTENSKRRSSSQIIINTISVTLYSTAGACRMLLGSARASGANSAVRA
jgi:hypothetical protein